MEFPKKYNPQELEKEMYKYWEENDKFSPKPSKTGKTFYIPMPPPNVTGKLHLGHSVFIALQDIMVRYHRMKGDETVYIPGTDHAGISTQNVVEKKLEKEGKKRVEMGREKFLEEVWKWKDEYEANICSQLRFMGGSADWSKYRFTLDEKLNKLVEYTFVDLYKKGLIYKGQYMVNYSPWLETVISDAEVEYREEDEFMYYITYFVSGSDNELVIATTRPETLLADQAVAVHPKDKRFKKLIGKSVILPILNIEIPIIGDEAVERDFGTGALKVTPSHDPTDFEIGRRHNLKLDYEVIDRKGMMNENAGIFAGQDYMTARENVVELLKAKGNLVKIEPYRHKVGYQEKSNCRIMSVVSTQWFVKSSVLIEKVIKGYEKGDFKIIPERFNKIFEDWIFNMRDWCISRQLWWGHRIPAYYDAVSGELLEVTADEEGVYKKYGKDRVRRDEDVLDTWFSSALWPYSILDWTSEESGELFKKFYPAQMLETGHDIIFFWVIRMLMMGYEYTSKTPFKNIYLHGLVRDEHGRKMSKSLGNSIDPVDVIKEYSADALRLSCVIGNTPGNDLKFSMKTVENNSLFLNKLWNATRFVYSSIGNITRGYSELQATLEANYDSLLSHEKWILSRLKNMIDETTNGMEKYNFSEIGFDLVHFTRDEYADFFIEEFKLTKDESKYGSEVLSFVILTILKLWHPYAPFITEKLYQSITDGKDLIDSDWPELNIKRDSKIEKQMILVMDIIRNIRDIRAKNVIKPTEMVKVFFATKDKGDIIEENKTIISGLGKCEDIQVFKTKKEFDSDNMSFAISQDIEIYIDISSFSNLEDEIERLKAEIEDKKEYLRILDNKLMDKNFIKRAPEAIVRKEQEKKQLASEQLAKMEEKLRGLV